MIQPLLLRKISFLTVTVVAAAALLIGGHFTHAGTPLPLQNPGFEDGTEGWDVIGPPFSLRTKRAAHSGTMGLRVTDQSDTQGSSIRSAKIPVAAGSHHAVRFWGRSLAGSGAGIYVEYWDAAGTLLSTKVRGSILVFTVPHAAKDWTPFTIKAQAPPEGAALTIWIHSFNASVTTAELDDFSVTALDHDEAKEVRTTPTPESRTSSFVPPTAQRIVEIAAMLPVQPRGLGKPIGARDAWDPLREDAATAGILRVAETFAESPPPELPDELYLEFTRTGNRRNYEIPYQKCSSRIGCLVVAECLENKGRFLPAIERDVRAMCEHRSWLLPACDGALGNFRGTHLTVALGSSLRAWMLANTLYWLGDRLPGDLRAHTYDEIRRRVLDPYLAALRSGTTRGNWWMLCRNNWNAVCNAGVTGAALAIVPSTAERAEILAGMEISNPFFIKGFTEDGYCSEGVGYWNYGFGRFMMMGLMVRDATGGALDIFTDPKLPAIARFPLDILIQPKVAPAFADCSVRARPDHSVLALIDRVFPDIIPGEACTTRPLSGNILTTAFHALHDRTSATPVAIGEESMATHSWFEQAGILVTRDHPGVKTPLGAAIKGGHNSESHNHNDVGSFVVVLAGEPLLLDPGSEVYTRRTFSGRRYESNVLNSYGHPVPVVGGRLQVTGPQARGEVLETSFSDSVSHLKLQMASAYRVPALTSLIRSFVHDRKTRTITVEDHARFSEPTTFAGSLITGSRSHRIGPDLLAVYDDTHALGINIAVEGSPWEYSTETVENPGRQAPTRLGVTLTEPVLEARIRFTIQPQPVIGLPGIYSDPTWGDTTPDLAEAVTVQAEDILEQKGGEIEVFEKVGAVGQAFRFWYHAGHRLTWQFRLPTAGSYAVRLRCCHAWKETVTRTLLIDGKPVEETPFVFPFTGGWSGTEDNWRDVWLARQQIPFIIRLTAATHTLSMDCPTETGLNLDWIQLVPVQTK